MDGFVPFNDVTTLVECSVVACAVGAGRANRRDVAILTIPIGADTEIGHIGTRIRDIASCRTNGVVSRSDDRVDVTRRRIQPIFVIVSL